jgi:hypothetical protein
MGQVCTICSHPERDAIEDAYIMGASKPTIADNFGVHRHAITNHMTEHLPALLALARDAERAARADSILDRLEELHARTLAILEATEATHDHRLALAAIREARSNLEIIAEVTRELDRRPVVNLNMAPEWLQLRAVIVTALEPYSEARGAVLQAIEGGLSGPA